MGRIKWLLACLAMVSSIAHALNWQDVKRTCGRFLSSSEPEFTPAMNLALGHFEFELRHANGFWQGRWEADLQPQPEFKSEALSLSIDFRLPFKLQWVRPVTLRLLTPPESASADWEPAHRISGQISKAFLIFEDVAVAYRTPEGLRVATPLSEIMRLSLDNIRRQNPTLKVEIHFTAAAEFGAAPFNRHQVGKTVAWVEGDLKNFQLLRSLLVCFKDAAEALMADPKYIFGKP